MLLARHILAAALVGLAATTPSKAEQKTVSVLGWASVIDYRKGPWAEVVKKFEAQNPDIKIKDVGVPDTEALNQITTMVLAHNPPDVAQVFGVWIPSLAQMGALADLSKLVPPDDLTHYPQISLDALTVDKQLVGYPYWP